MAASPTPKPTRNKLPAPPAINVPVNPAAAALSLGVRIPTFPPNSSGLAVAYSGGADSTALLLAAAAHWPGQVHAIHIHHGLQAAADDFVRVCEAVCAGINVPLHVVRVDASAATGESPEDAARKARYKALAAKALRLGVSGVLLGQHADDQVETLLLALSRGAGLPGLSGMGPQFEREGMQFYRPLLETSAAELRAWLVQQKIPFVDDPTNTDERYTRNMIRARLLPALDGAFPQFRETYARSARHAAQAHELLVEVAAEDLVKVGSPPAIKSLQALSKNRQANVLRYWLLGVHGATPSAAQLEQLLSQIAACTTRGHQIDIKVATGHVTRIGAVLGWR
ncbi:MAG: tRNA lysidine(34) synthetase TilS [Polaromonas sp.]|uniref:tRNA lysidine(34) synthetase TilS n=1 Tax=Polaromonas sp. TaxID=1869339 RepID=UPI0025F0BF56|nr:tRNA lysidine(34) synthetase TilS [Polaromonas sp.]MBI2728965.1 tRNA lysidine(34) synthetase TilS [Polaromonas sp.]